MVVYALLWSGKRAVVYWEAERRCRHLRLSNHQRLDWHPCQIAPISVMMRLWLDILARPCKTHLSFTDDLRHFRM